MTKHEHRYDAMVLFQLIKIICNGSINVIVEDALGNIVEALHNFTLIRGEEHNALPKCMEASHHAFESLKMVNFDMKTSGMRDSYVDELRSRKQDCSALHENLKAWSEAGTSDEEKLVITTGRCALTEAFRARICMNRSGR